MSTTFSGGPSRYYNIGRLIALIVLIVCVIAWIFSLHKVDPFILGCIIALAIARLL